MAQISFTQSTRFRCPQHGHRAAGFFVRPDAGEGFAAFYCCLMRIRQIGVEHNGGFTTISRDQAIQLQQACVPDEHSTTQSLRDLLRKRPSPPE